MNLIKHADLLCKVQKKKTENLNSKISNSKNGRIIMQSKCAVCGIKKSIFVKEQETKGLLSNLGLKTSLNKNPLLGDILFWVYKMNDIVNKFLLAGNKFMPEMHLKQPGFIYSDCGPFNKTKERTENFMKIGNTDFI